ncbi:MAG: MarR family winged helix-turn-helix transcriptional regulator [Xanthobacter sp.]
MTCSDPSPRLRFGFQFVTLARQWRQAVDARLAATGLTDATWAPLVHLQEAGDGISQKDLAARVGIEGSTLVRLLDILVKQELVERHPHEADRRTNRIVLTDRGREVLTSIRRQLSEAEASFLADLSDADLAFMLDVFGRIGARLNPASSIAPAGDAAR